MVEHSVLIGGGVTLKVCTRIRGGGSSRKRILAYKWRRVQMSEEKCCSGGEKEWGGACTMVWPG